MRGQVSAEYLVLLSVVIIIALITVSMISDNTGGSSNAIQLQTQTAFGSLKGVAITSWLVDTKGTRLSLQNTFDTTITINTVSLNSNVFYVERRLKPLEKITVSSPYPYVSESELYQYDVEINYTAINYGQMSFSDDLLKLTGSSSSGNTTLNESLTKGLIGYYRLDELGTEELDQSSTNSTVYCSSCPSSDATDGAQTFDGASDRYTTGTYISDFGGTKISGFAWIKTAGAGASYRGIIAQRTAWSLVAKDNELMVYSFTEGDVATGIDINDDLWHHVGFTFESAVVNGLKIYINGSLVQTGTLTTVTPADGFVIGSDQPVTDSGYFAGNIDSVMIYNRILSAKEVTKLYYAKRS
ncbi:MAG: hypothetical protein ACI8Y7_000988 [Candidatus Woesearchaeota archaeon]|jgi:uncharacterized protein (UPF0333 family)